MARCQRKTGIPSNGRGRPATRPAVHLRRWPARAQLKCPCRSTVLTDSVLSLQETFTQQQQQHMVAHRNTGKIAERAKWKWLQVGKRLFGCWGPVPWLFVPKTTNKQPTKDATTTGKHDNGCLGPAPWLFMRQRSWGPLPWLFTCYGIGGEGEEDSRSLAAGLIRAAAGK